MQQALSNLPAFYIKPQHKWPYLQACLQAGDGVDIEVTVFYVLILSFASPKGVMLTT